MVGRPTKFCPELADAICSRMIEGESLRAICRDDDMPSAGTVLRWVGEGEREDADPDKQIFRNQYARATEARADYFAEEMLDIADDGSNDWMERRDADGKKVGWQVNGENIQRSRLRVDARKWNAARMKPKKYGDRMAIAGDDDSPLRINVKSWEGESGE